MNTPLIGFGNVWHRRLRPVAHEFRYRSYFLLLPLRRLRDEPFPALNRNRRGALSFHDADHGVGAIDQALPGIEHAIDRGIAALCAEAVGVMATLNAQTLEYLKNRKQFGQPIGKFQALQHRMADMYVHLEQARSMALLAAVRLAGEARGDTAAAERRRAVSAAKYRVGQAARFVGQQAIHELWQP